MATTTSERMSYIHQLRQKHQQELHAVELINRDEVERRLSLRSLILRDANMVLEDSVSEKQLHIISLKENLEALKMELLEAKRRSSEHESRLLTQQNEIRALESDMENLNSSAQVSNGAMQDKAALTRELNSLRLELEQLKSQLVSHQAIVASNGDLRRQVNTLEVDLENQKRSNFRAQQADEKGVISDLRSRLQQCQSKLNTEEKERETLKRELADSRDETEQQRGRCAHMQPKLKELQSTLRDAQADLQQSRRELLKIKEASATTVEEPLVTPRKAKRVIIEPRVAAVETSSDAVDLQTSGNEESSEIRQQRRRRTGHALVGEKSTFSITPFLNKSRGGTVCADLDSDRSASDAGAKVSPERPRARKRKNSPAMSPTKPSQHSARHGQAASLTKDALKARVNLRKSSLSQSGVSAKSGKRTRARLGNVTVGKVANNNKEDTESETAAQQPELKPSATTTTTTTEGDEPNDQVAGADGQKKKRKLLGGRGRTVFDDDEMEVDETASILVRLAPGKRGRAQLGGVGKACAGAGNTFSPLKKERRGVNASFIV